jgi:hypothetical protein
MSYKPVLIGCSSAEQFFDRFKANEKQRKSYKPIFLAIIQSSYGECAPSFGLFEKNDQLYSVYGNECSMWDFNGQFNPELTTIDSLLLEVKNEIGMVDGQNVFNTTLSNCIKNLELSNRFNSATDNALIKDYVDYINSFEIGNISDHSKFINSEHLEIFKSNLVNIEDNIDFYKFKIKSDWDEVLTLFLKPDGTLNCSETKNESYIRMDTQCIIKFVSDLIGSIELQTNIFEEENVSVKKNKPK